VAVISTNAHPEIVDFDSGRGLSVFATTGIVHLFRKTVNGHAIIAKKRKRSPGPKDAVSGSTLTICLNGVLA
jgi:hypothetical protein